MAVLLPVLQLEKLFPDLLFVFYMDHYEAEVEAGAKSRPCDTPFVPGRVVRKGQKWNFSAQFCAEGQVWPWTALGLGSCLRSKCPVQAQGGLDLIIFLLLLPI